MEEKKKSEFMLAAEAFAKQMGEMTSKDGVKRGIVILASENIDGENQTAQTIAVVGNGMEITKAIARFSTSKDTKKLFYEGMKLGAIKTVFETIGGDLAKNVNITIKS